MRKEIIATSVGALALGSVLWSTAGAQEGGYLSQTERAPSHALELKAASGYTQGFGNVAPGRDLNQVAGAGVGVSADIDYRISRAWSVGLEGQYQAFAKQENSSAWGLTTNVGGTYHFNPLLRGDPWLRLGTGYRFITEKDVGGVTGMNTDRHGFDLATAKIGYDVRVSKDVAIAPVLGADVNLFVWQTNDGASAGTAAGTKAMSTSQVATFIYAGVQGRFDIGGRRSDGIVVSISSAKEPAPVATVTPAPVVEVPPAEEPEPVTSSISISPEVQKKCAVELGSVDQAPKFEFDKSDLQDQDQAILEKISECFTTGPMKDSKLKLVGRADPRGTIEYNDKLGARRAENVAGFLQKAGLGSARIAKESRGERDASGKDEESYRKDRRVDVLAAPPAKEAAPTNEAPPTN